MNKTKIEWTDFTWNPITGCLGPNGDGVRCSYCYANKLANGRLKPLYLSHSHPLTGDTQDPFAPRFWVDRLEEPTHLKKPAKIFVCDMGELLGNWVPRVIKNDIFAIIKRCPWHTFQLLTKQDQNLHKFSPYPDNCWVGVSVEGRDLGRPIYFLNQIKATVKFISFEPLLYPVTQVNLIQRLNWVILGGKSGRDPFYPPIEWINEIELKTRTADIPIFEKNNLFPPNQRYLMKREFPAIGVAAPILDPRLQHNAKERREARLKYAGKEGKEDGL